MTKAIEKKTVIIKVDDSEMSAFVARPVDEGEYPAVMIFFELFGVNDNIRDINNKIAALGYIAIAPDFYHRSNLDHEIPYGEQGRKQGFAELDKLKRATIFEDVEAVIKYLQSRNDFSGRMGVAGFSVGGHIAFLAATQFDFKAVACFYAGWLTNTEITISQPEPTIELSKGIAEHDAKLIYFVGADDMLMTKDKLDAMEKKLKAENVRYELIVYPNTSHGFFCDQRPADFNQAAHDDSWLKLQNLLKEELSVIL